jgi:hypothetical protein
MFLGKQTKSIEVAETKLTNFAYNIIFLTFTLLFG